MPDIAPRIDAAAASLENYRNRAIHSLCIAGPAGFPHISLRLARRHCALTSLSLLGPRPGSTAA